MEDMMSSQFRIPVDGEYVCTLGRAVYSFSYLEWGIIWLTETLKPGFLAIASQYTAGHIGKEFEKYVTELSNDVHDRAQLIDLADKFGGQGKPNSLVKLRNRLVHANPYTAEAGEQQLIYGQIKWTIAEITSLTLLFEEAAIQANSLLHNGRLEMYWSNH